MRATDDLVEQVIRQSIGSARLSGYTLSPEAVDRIRRLAYGEITADEAVAETVEACVRRQSDDRHRQHPKGEVPPVASTSSRLRHGD